MHLDDWLDHIGRLHPKRWDLGLERVGDVGRRLGVLKPARQVYLVAGTNGKGTTCEAIAWLLRAQGLSVGKSVSPHLVRFNERIEVDGIFADDAEICTAFETIERVRGDTSLSYFEFGALAAMLVFKQRDVDAAVLEIGLGGRLDAMNIVDPDVSVITRIALDHQSWLGETREAIAIEKAGVMRRDRYCVIADDEPPHSLAARAAETGARPLYIGKDFGIDADGRLYCTRGDRNPERVDLLCKAVPVALPAQSLAAAVQAVCVAGYIPKASQVETMFESLRLPGRFQVVDGTVRTVLDVAHNPDAAQWLADRLENVLSSGACHAVFGMYRDKDCDAVIRIMQPRVDAWHITAAENDDRAASPAALADLVSDAGGSVAATYDKVAQAYDGALGQCEAGDTVLVFGSFPVVGGVLEHLNQSLQGSVTPFGG